MPSTSATVGHYNYRTGVTTYAYGCYNTVTGQDLFVGRTRNWATVAAYMAQHLTPAQVASTISQGTGCHVGNLEYWVNAGH